MGQSCWVGRVIGFAKVWLDGYGTQTDGSGY